MAYAISITSCNFKLTRRLFDGAAVLKRSIELNSWPKHPHSRYASNFYALVLKQDDGELDECSKILQLAGWEVLLQDNPIVYTNLIKEPEGSSLKAGIGGDGCCGDKELIKLATYKLTNHPIAVHLDLDTLVLHPMDELYNAMHFNSDTVEGKQARMKLGEVVAPTYLNRRSSGNPAMDANITMESILTNMTVNAYFTKDYNMIGSYRHAQRVGVQGGFLVVRPSVATYTSILELIYSGEFYPGHDAGETGWFKSGYGRHIWGSLTIQGLMAYYFDVLEIQHSIELNRCRYNNIADNARVSTFANNPKYPRGTLLPFVRDESNPRYNFVDTTCRDSRESCDDVDCQRFPLEKVRLSHFTYCKMPWRCSPCSYLETYKEPMCYAMLREWFRVRKTLFGEERISLDDVNGPDNDTVTEFGMDGEVLTHKGNCYKEYFLGYCQGEGNYVAMANRNISAFPDHYEVVV